MYDVQHIDEEAILYVQQTDEEAILYVQYTDEEAILLPSCMYSTLMILQIEHSVQLKRSALDHPHRPPT